MSRVIELSTLEKALTLFHADSRGTYIQTSFWELDLKLRTAQALNATKFPIPFHLVTQDLWNMGTLISRLVWMRKLSVAGSMPKDLWRVYSSLDVENYFVQLRSLMDHAAHIINLMAPKPNQLPDSFSTLRNSFEKYKNKLDQNVLACIISADWFDELRDIRDELVHSGGFSLIFGEPSEGILFQVYKKNNSKLISNEHLHYNENVVYFERYASLQFANLLIFLEDLGNALHTSLSIHLTEYNTRSYCSGFQDLQQWIFDLQKLVQLA